MASSLVAAASLVRVLPFERTQFAVCEQGFSSQRVAPVGLLSRNAKRKSERRRGGAARASSSGTADENIIPESSPSGSGGGHSCVDADMMMLRRRIEGMRVKETFFLQKPEEWMEWEKNWYSAYRTDVNVLVASLQSQLLGMRPGVVLAIVSFLLVATPVAGLLFLSAVGTQLYTLNSALLDFLTPCSAASLPL